MDLDGCGPNKAGSSEKDEGLTVLDLRRSGTPGKGGVAMACR